MKVMQWLATCGFGGGGRGSDWLGPPMGRRRRLRLSFRRGLRLPTLGYEFGKPDVLLIPGLASSSSVWDAESKLLAPNYRLHVVQVDGFAGAPAGPNAAPGMLPGIVEELHQYIFAAGQHPVVIGHSPGRAADDDAGG